MVEWLRVPCLAWSLALAALAPANAANAPAPCRLRGLEHEALCGSVVRPLDPARPQGPSIDVHYAVLPAVATHKRPDPVFFFAGGPGQSAIDNAPQIAALLARFSNGRDVVLVDQRGTGRSAPLNCDADDPARPLAEQFDPARQRARLTACRERLERLPYGDLRDYTTPIAVADADAVRAALGAERVDLIGASYGTRVALEYLRQFPDRVRRVVIDGVAPADMVLPASFSTDNQAALDAVFDACARAPACARAWPTLRADWQALLAGLPRDVRITHPWTGRPETLQLTRDAVLNMVRGPLYVPALAAGLPQAIAAAAAGRFEPMAGLAQALGGRRGTGIAAGMHYAVVCSEDVPRLDTSSDRPGADFGSASAEAYRDACRGWPRAALPAGYGMLAPTPAATLVLSGGADPATPPRHAERIVRALGAKARHVVVPQAGHGVMAIGCLRDAVYRFVDAETDADALRVDTACAAGLPRPPAALPIEARR